MAGLPQVAGTNTEALEQIAGNMMRGTQEVSIDDSMRVVRAELHRAALVLTRAEREGRGAMQSDQWYGAGRQLAPSVASLIPVAGGGIGM